MSSNFANTCIHIAEMWFFINFILQFLHLTESYNYANEEKYKFKIHISQPKLNIFTMNKIFWHCKFMHNKQAKFSQKILRGYICGNERVKVLRTFGYGAAGMGSSGGAVCIGKTNGSGEVILIGKPIKSSKICRIAILKIHTGWNIVKLSLIL